MRRAAAGQVTALRPAARTRIGEFLEVLDGAAARMERAPVDEVAEAILEAIRYEEYLEKLSEREAPGRWENVQELLAAMQEFAESPDREDTSVRAFLEEMSLATDIDEYDENASRVTLMTLHNAKGLEFPCVFITGLEEGLFPHANSAYEQEGLEEERRLFYVGLTRARERAVLLHAAARRRWGGFETCEPSRFLDEIDPDLLERRSFVPETRGGGRARGARAGGWGRRAGASPRERFTREEVFLPDYEGENQDAGRVEPGMRVRHPSWGEGVIESLEGRGAALKLTIRFAGGMRKKVLAAYAHLELLG
jgi:DNA helicase-2/ATP-dependent DNA helicase PcrA